MTRQAIIIYDGDIKKNNWKSRKLKELAKMAKSLNIDVFRASKMKF